MLSVLWGGGYAWATRKADVLHPQIQLITCSQALKKEEKTRAAAEKKAKKEVEKAAKKVTLSVSLPTVLPLFLLWCGPPRAGSGISLSEAAAYALLSSGWMGAQSLQYLTHSDPPSFTRLTRIGYSRKRRRLRRQKRQGLVAPHSAPMTLRVALRQHCRLKPARAR